MWSRWKLIRKEVKFACVTLKERFIGKRWWRHSTAPNLNLKQQILKKTHMYVI